ncbi:Ldh family oxidoreductase [Teredinibacter sp. KSP-S5-2]|uniref:Ldh family oxidoreductase n=1 Tax=Teredinibacter sp. KSP-S5-2 TaxID=3034506 RepID=UPI002934B81C|nr:Ldh family oxidoreductase [Teredinibacter sp. KSP-S5-2]WNO11594.1 Ldh family oxidoreductase [Teredinibacter sp. KSP-S5-2]
MLRVDAERLNRIFCCELMSIGLSISDSTILVSNLIETSLSGIDTHGIRLLPTYISEFKQGGANISPVFRFENELLSSAILDADGANGVIAGNAATDKAIEMARKTGIGMVLTKNSNHFGAASSFTKQAANQRLIAISLSNSDALVALEGGTRPFLGTNPIAMTVPGLGDDCFELDFATSQISYSKVKYYLQNGIDLPQNWCVDENGSDSSTSQLYAALKALGGYKGQGIGLMVQVLTSVMSGMPYDHQLTHLYTPPFDKPRQISHWIICFNPEIFIRYEEFQSRVSELISEARINTPSVILPGDKEKASREERLANGIPIDDKDYDWVNELINKYE